MKSTYGKRGQAGPTRGRKITKYTAMAPDGTTLVKGTFFCSDHSATMVIYQHAGQWHANAVYPHNALPRWTEDRTKVVAMRM